MTRRGGGVKISAVKIPTINFKARFFRRTDELSDSNPVSQEPLAKAFVRAGIAFFNKLVRWSIRFSTGVNILYAKQNALAYSRLQIVNSPNTILVEKKLLPMARLLSNLAMFVRSD